MLGVSSESYYVCGQKKNHTIFFTLLLEESDFVKATLHYLGFFLTRASGLFGNDPASKHPSPATLLFSLGAFTEQLVAL